MARGGPRGLTAVRAHGTGQGAQKPPKQKRARSPADVTPARPGRPPRTWPVAGPLTATHGRPYGRGGPPDPAHTADTQGARRSRGRQSATCQWGSRTLPAECGPTGRVACNADGRTRPSRRPRAHVSGGAAAQCQWPAAPSLSHRLGQTGRRAGTDGQTDGRTASRGGGHRNTVTQWERAELRHQGPGSSGRSSGETAQAANRPARHMVGPNCPTGSATWAASSPAFGRRCKSGPRASESV